MAPRLFSRASLLAALACGTIGLGAAFASADQVVMRDGNVYDGTVVSQTRREIVIDTEINGIRTRLTLDRRLIQAVTTGEVPEAPTDIPTAPSFEPGLSIPSTPILSDRGGAERVAKPTLKREGVDLIVEIPMVGTFGQDIYPLSIAEGLEWAAEQGATDIVFRLNSGGGEVWAADEIVEIMSQHAGKFRYHALIEQAISATIWTVFNCDTITMVPGATVGGAVVYRMGGTGSAEVDLKMNSIIASKLAATAESKGHHPALVRAMILSEAAVYAERRGGSWVLTDTVPTEPGYDTIDGPDSVLTLTADQAAKYGIATTVAGRDISDFAEAQGFGDYDHHVETTTEIADRANEKCKRLRGDLIGTIKSFVVEIDMANDRNTFSGRGSSLQTMRTQLGRYRVLLRRAEDLKMDAIVGSLENAIDIPYWETQIQTRMSDLQRERRRQGRP